MHQKQQLYIKQATACGYKRYEFTANLGDVLEVVSDNKLKICSSTNNTYCHADVTSATDYSPFGAPLPERQYTAGLQATHTVAAAHFNGSTSGWQAHGANSVVSSYCGNLRAVITNRGSQGQGMKKTFATTPGQLYKVSFLINVMAWPALVITDPTTGAELLRTPTNMPGQYSYTFMAQSTHTTIAFEEIVATNSTILLCNFTLQEVGGRYVAGFQGQHADDEVAGAGNSYTAEFWQYDSRLGRRWNVDPITYPWQSSYAVFNNCPLVFIDPLGLSGEETNDPPKDPKEGDKHTRTHTNGNKFEYEYKNGKWEETGGTGTFDEVIITPNKSNTPQKESNKNSFSLSNVLDRLKQLTSSTLNKIGSFLHETLKKGHREEYNYERKFEVKGGVVGYDKNASGVKNESKVSSNPYAYVDYGAILPTLEAAKDAGTGAGILQSKKWYETIVNTISATNTTIRHGKDLDSGVEFDLKRNIHRSAPYTYDTIEYYKQGKLVGKTIHGEFTQEGN